MVDSINTNTPTPPFTVTLVKDEDRLSFLPRYLGKSYLEGERIIYSFARKFCVGYVGGFWDFYEVSNGAFFLSLAGKEDASYAFSVDSNFFEGKLSGQAVGIVVTLYALNLLISMLHEIENDPNSEADKELVSKNQEALTLSYYALRDYAFSRPDADLIYQAID